MKSPIRKTWHRVFAEELFPCMAQKVLKETPQLMSLREALGGINRHWESGLYTEDSKFSHLYGLTTENLQTLSEELGVEIKPTDKLIHICDEIHKRKIYLRDCRLGEEPFGRG